MKIEKVNENQIRCTLTREDLADRQLKLSELAYGTEKAKMLFRDMMQQAAYECVIFSIVILLLPFHKMCRDCSDQIIRSPTSMSLNFLFPIN